MLNLRLPDVTVSYRNGEEEYSREMNLQGMAEVGKATC